MSGGHHFGLCGPDCRYRSLYEGSQASLTDMAGNQATALTRVGRLRQGLVDALKQTFPVEFSDAEAKLGKRMSTIDDEVLLAYLTAFLAMPKAQTAARIGLDAAPRDTGLDALRAALAGAGITLPVEDDPALWAGQVTAWAGKRTPPQVRVTAPTEPGMAPVVEVSTARMVTDPNPAPRAADLTDVFDDYAPFDLSDEPAPWDAPPPPPAPVPPAADPDGVWGSLFEDEPEPELDPAAAPIPDHLPPLPDPATAAATRETPTQPPAEAPREPAPVAPVLPAMPTGTTPTAPVEAEPVTETPAADPVADPVVEPAPRTPRTTVSTREAGPVKPEMFPQAPKKTTRRKPVRRESRVSATAPGGDPRNELAGAAASGELTDELREKLLATVCMARPVFIADLVHLVGNADLVEQWERECRSQGTASPIRFIAAKPRHKARGHLVIPHSEELRTSSSEFEKSTWSKCITNHNLKGAKLYELAVLLHRWLDNVVTFDIGNEIVTLRVNQKRGLVGVIMVLNADVSHETEARQELAGALAGMGSGRLSLLAICSYAGGPRTIPDLAEAAREDIEDTNLSLSFPVIAQSSWEFAADGGTSAISVLG